MTTELRRFAHVVAGHPAGAVVEAKRLLRANEGVKAEDAAKAEDEVLFQRYGGPENMAAIQAFLASRKK